MVTGNVLVVDDDEQIRQALVDRLGHWGHRAAQAKDGDEAMKAASAAEFDVVLLDLLMPGRNGLEVLRDLKQAGCTADVVVLTAQGSIESAVEAIRGGAADFLTKPADFSLLKAVIDRLLEQRRLVRVNQSLVERVQSAGPVVLGSSAGMKQLLETASRAAQGTTTILLTGESGSGKQVLAEYLHAQSPRHAGPFVYLNCVALSDELIESTLFGHERGAFTGAVSRKEGRLEAAAGGTAFLDEVGDVSPRLQAKLLHFLESGEFERVGGTRTIRVDCRVIAATNRDLEAAVREGAFREDLYFRLNVIGLRIPPLRERTEDIPELAEAFLARFAAELRRGALRFAPETLGILTRYAWPGNVRQLRNAVERMAVLAPGEILTPDLLPPELTDGAPASDAEPTDLPFKDAVHEFRKRYLARALRDAGGNQRVAAERLGLQRTFLNRLIRTYGL